MYSTSYFNIWKVVWGAKPPCDDWLATDVYFKTCIPESYQVGLGLILMLSGDYNFLRSTVSWTTLFNTGIAKLCNWFD